MKSRSKTSPPFGRRLVIPALVAWLGAVCTGRAAADSAPAPPPSDVATESYRVFDLQAHKLAIRHLTVDQLKDAKVTKVSTLDGLGATSDLTAACGLKVDLTSLVPEPATSCGALWSKIDPGTLSVRLESPTFTRVIEFRSERPFAANAKFAKTNTLLVIAGMPEVTQAVIYVPPSEAGAGEWRMVVPTGSQITIDSSIEERLRGNELRLAVVTKGGSYQMMQLQLDNSALPAPAPDLDRPALEPFAGPSCTDEIGARGFAWNGSPVFCFDTTPQQQVKLTQMPDDQFVLPPNRTIFVLVRTWDDDIPVVSMTGTVGLSDAKLNNQASAQSGTRRGAPVTHTARVTVWPFAPRQSGQTPTITVKIVKQADRTAVVDQLAFDTVVDTVYYGALRLGIAIGFGRFDHGYQAQKVGGSSVSEVVATADTSTNLELVLGFAPYLDGLASGKLTGRTYGRGSGAGLAPLFGVGLLGQGNKGLEGLKSFYLGLELELGRNFSIAATYVGRFVNALPANVAVGSAVPDGPLTTRTSLVSGGAIVLNLSPDFFKVAAGGVKP